MLEQLINAIITFLSIFAGVYFASWYFERKIKKYIFLLTGINLNDLIKNRNKEDPLKKLKEKLKS